MLKSAGTALTHAEPLAQSVGRLLAGHGKLAADDLRNVPRYVLRALIGVTVVFGLLSLWGSHGDGKIPGMSPLCGLDPYHISSAHCIADKTDAIARWKGLSPALAILDKVNPVVATWVRERPRGLVTFGGGDRTKGDPAGALAKYDMFRGCIVVKRELFCENDGTIAAILCHEYRHSRQNWGTFAQYVLSFLFKREGDLSIIENDAVIYEHAAHEAIFGSGTCRDKEVAAWVRSVQLDKQVARHWRGSPASVSAVAEASGSP